MPDFRVAETAAEHAKLRSVGLAAFGLWAAAGSYAMRELTDGWVPDYWVQTWPGAKRATGALLSAGLWRRQQRGQLPGYVFHDWHDHQRSAAQIHTEREEARERARKRRERARSSGERSPEHTSHVQVESHDSRALTRALTPSGSSWEGTSRTERADSRNTPRPRCPEHAELPPDQRVPSCGACKQLRLDAEQRAADQAEREAADRAVRRDLIDACPDCDEIGMRDLGLIGVGRCTHPNLMEEAAP